MERDECFRKVTYLRKQCQFPKGDLVYESSVSFRKGSLFTKAVSVSEREACLRKQCQFPKGKLVYESSVSFRKGSLFTKAVSVSEREACLRKQCQFPKGDLFTKAVPVSKRWPVYESSAGFQKVTCPKILPIKIPQALFP